MIKFAISKLSPGLSGPAPLAGRFVVAVRYAAVDKDIVIVAAAGNQGGGQLGSAHHCSVPSSTCASALAVAGAAQWTSNFAITVTFPMLLAGIGLAGAYGIYAVAAILSIVFVGAAVVAINFAAVPDKATQSIVLGLVAEHVQALRERVGATYSHLAQAMRLP